MKLKDSNGGSGLYVDSTTRGKVFDRLLDAKASLPTMAHPGHGHINKAINLLGGVVSDASDPNDGNLDLSSPGERTRVNPIESGAAPSAASASDVSAKSAKLQKSATELKRDQDVSLLYKTAARTSDPDLKRKAERIAIALDSLDLSFTRKTQQLPGGLGRRAAGPRTSFASRHGF